MISPFTLKRLVSDDFYLWERKCWNFLLRSRRVKPFCGSPNSGMSVVWKLEKARENRTRNGSSVRDTVKSNSEKSSGSLNCFSFLTGLGIKANSTKCKSAIFICLTAFSSDYPPISDLIHLARGVKFNPQFNPWIVLIGLRGTEFNRRINLLRGFGRFNLGLALIGFRTTGAWLTMLRHQAAGNSVFTSGAAKKVLFSSRDNCNCLILKQFQRISYFLGIQAWVLRQNGKQKKYAQKSGQRSTFSFLISLFFIISQNACLNFFETAFELLLCRKYGKKV